MGVDCSLKDLVRQSFLGHFGHMAEPTLLGSIDSLFGEVARHAGLYGFQTFALCHEVLHRQVFANIPSLPFILHLRFMIRGRFCQVRYQCWQKESTMLKFFVFISSSETTHVASFLFFDRGLIQCDLKGQNITPSSHCCLTRQPPCFACALQPPTFCLHCSLIHRQASGSKRWNSKTLPQLH